jgi:cell division protein FtsW
MTKSIKINFRNNTAIWVIMGWLGFVGLLAVFSSTARIGNTTPAVYLTKQLMYLVVGFALCYGISLVRLSFFNGIAGVCFWGITIVWWIMQFWAWHKGMSSPRTINLHIISFQPAEFAKIAVVLYLASVLSVNQPPDKKSKTGIKSFRTVFKKIIFPLICIGAPIFLSNFSTLVLIGVTSAGLMWLGNVRTRHLALLVLVAGILLWLGMMAAQVTTEHNQTMRRHGEKPSSFWLKTESVVKRTRLATINSRLRKSEERRTDSKKNTPKDFEQVDYAHLAIAGGSILPTIGPGNSKVKYMLPEAFSDFIFAVIVEEYGVLLSTVFILLIFFVILPWRIGVWIKKTTNLFATFLLIGLGLLLTLQTLMHVIVCVSGGKFPVTGQNLPLVSHGGSSIISTCIMFGLIMCVINYISGKRQQEGTPGTENV